MVSDRPAGRYRGAGQVRVSRTAPSRPASEFRKARGLWSALWLLPADSGSRPEIDILEVVGQQPDELIMHLHPQDPAMLISPP